MSIIEAKNLSFSYGANVVLDNISFSIEAGDYVGIVGPNGGGKSTLLKILVGLLMPQSGSLQIEGVESLNYKKRFEIGYVPQRAAQDSANFPATVYEIVESGRLATKGLFNFLNSTDKLAIHNVMEVAGIKNLEDNLISSLSGGQKQRVYVARALASQPKILILDEPFTGVDINAQKDFYGFLKKLNESHGLTIIFVSHDIDVITDEVKSVLCLNKNLLCLNSPNMLHEANIIEEIYGKKITHIHHNH
jgi:zinc transport system ATP-binding protein